MVKKIKFRITTDGRGKISSGDKKNGLPHALDHFDVSEFPELVQMYGDKPDKLMVFFPADQIEDFYETAYNSWGTGPKGPVKKRTCDGEKCLHRINETINGKTYAAGEESDCICDSLPEDSKDRCRYDCWFKAFVADPKTGRIENTSCYMFTTHSQNSADAIFSELEKIKYLNSQTLRSVPFVLSVKMCSGKSDAAHKFPIWSLQALGLLSQIRENAGKLIGFDTPPLQIEGQSEASNPVPETPADPKKRAADLREYILAINDQDTAKAKAWLKTEQLRLHLGVVPSVLNMLEMDVKTMYDANQKGIEVFLKKSDLFDGEK